jgi:hypothetical protein
VNITPKLRIAAEMERRRWTSFRQALDKVRT